MRQFPKRIATRTGAAVVTIDHVNKSTDTRGRFAIGGQAKLAALDGAAYLIEPLDALAPGKVGKIAMRVTKDRPGGIRKHAVNYRKSDRTQEAAIIKMDATGDQLKFWVNTPESIDERTEIKHQTTQDRLQIIVTANPGIQPKQIMAIWKENYPDEKGRGIGDKTLKAQTEAAEAIGWLTVDRTKVPFKYNLAEIGLEYVG